MSNALLLEKMRASRECWVDIPGMAGVRVKVRRPLDVRIGPFLHQTPQAMMQEALVGWDGFTEATLLGAAIGSSDPLEFDQALAVEFVCDDPERVQAVSKYLTDIIKAHLQQKAKDEKN